jgi:isochorismate hydrolase
MRGGKMDYLERIKPYNIRQARPKGRETALLVIDMQAYFQGVMAPILEPVMALVRTCTSLDIPILFTRHGHPNPATDGGMLGRWWGDLIQYGTDDWELIQELKAGDRGTIVDKDRYSAFHGTGLEDWLRERGISDLVISGVMTNCCCETTARDAFVRDFRVFFVADATATSSEELHVASLMNLAYGFAYVVGTQWVCKMLINSMKKR